MATASAENLRDVDLVIIGNGDADAGLAVILLEDVASMSRAVHPASNARRRDFFQRLPVIRSLVPADADAAEQVVLKEVLAEAFPEGAASDFFPARVAGTFSTCGRVQSVGIHVAEKIAGRHVVAVASRDLRQSLVDRERCEPVFQPFVIDQVMNAAFEARDADLGLAGPPFLSRARHGPRQTP